MIDYEKGEKLLTVAEVSEMLHIHPNTLRRWADEGKIASYRITSRGDRRFKQDEVNKFLERLNPRPDRKRRQN